MARIDLRRYGIGRREIALAVLAGLLAGAAVSIAHSPAAGLAAAYLVTVMLLIAVIDGRRMLIPDVLSLPSIIAGLAAACALAADPGPVLFDHAGAAAAGGLALLALREAYRRSRGLEGLGLGDVKLAAAAGAWVGLADLPLVILLASLAALVTVAAKAAMRGAGPVSPLTALPFGSFLAPALAAVWICRVFLA